MDIAHERNRAMEMDIWASVSDAAFREGCRQLEFRDDEDMAARSDDSDHETLRH